MSNNPRTDRDDKGRFLTGNTGGGRPKGARSRLGEAFLNDLADAWADHGVDAIERVAKSDPGTFCKIVSNVLPKEVVQMAFSVNANVDFADVEEAKAYLAAYRHVRDHVPTDSCATIEHLTAEAEVAWRVDDDD